MLLYGTGHWTASARPRKQRRSGCLRFFQRSWHLALNVIEGVDKEDFKTRSADIFYS